MLAASAWLAGCGPELHNRGGFIDQKADRYLFVANTPKERLLRAYLVHAGLVRLASVAPSTSYRRATYFNHIINMNDRFRAVLECVNNCFYYDSVMVEYEDALLQSAIAIIDEDSKSGIIDVLASISTGGASDLVGKLLSVAKSSWRYGRPMGALYRDYIYLRLEIFLEQKTLAPSGSARAQAEEYSLPDAQKKMKSLQPDAALSIWNTHFESIQSFIEYSCLGLGIKDITKTGDTRSKALETCIGTYDFKKYIGERPVPQVITAPAEARA
ncbi:hypothetical protein ACFQ4O_10845 [Methylopila musalis]|uniref:Uncharacterized protein n=1 Tax=Methylopila musalis TaxID=1134781 RepID=A0ABW3Z844_9HYPH